MLGGTQSIGATMRSKVESVGNRLRLDRRDQYDPSRNKGAKCRRTSTEEQDFEALSGQLGCRASEPARNTEDVQAFLQSKRQADETAPLGIEPEAESR